MKKNILFVSALLTLITGCSSIPLLPEPYEIRYFNIPCSFSKLVYTRDWYGETQEKNHQCPNIKLIPKSTVLLSGLRRFFIPNHQAFDDYIYVYNIRNNEPYQIIAKEDNNVFLTSKSLDEKYLIQLPIATLEKCTINEETYKKEKAKKNLAQKAAAKKAAEKKAKEEAEKKRKIEQQVAEKNNEVIKKYGKPYCNPFKVRAEDDTYTPYILGASNMVGGTFAGKKRNCLFEETFLISQVTPYGMLVYGRETVCEGYNIFNQYCYDKKDGPYFVIPNESDKELVDGDYISGLFEYIGNYSYETIVGAPKTVLKFKHVSK